MSAIVHAATSVTPPVQDDNIWVRAGTASSQTLEIPAAWRGHWVTIQAQGDGFYFAFGSSSVSVDETAVTATSGGAFTTFDGDECVHIPDGQSKDYDLRKIAKDVTDFAWKGTGTAGYIRITRSSGASSID